MASERQPGLGDFLAVLRRRKLLILFAVIVTTAGALFYASGQPKLYQASAQVLLNPDASLVNGAGQSAADAQARFDVGQAQIAHTVTIAGKALKIASAPRGMTPDGLVSNSSVSSDPNSNLLTFEVTNRSPKLARRLANAYVNAYATASADQLTGRVVAAIAQLSQQITGTQTRIQRAKSAGNSAAALYAELKGLIVQRTKDQQDLTSIRAGGGATISREAQGAEQIQPRPNRDAALGIALGLLLGVALAFLRESLDTRVRSVDEISDRLGIRLLARIPPPPRKLAKKQRLVTLEPRGGEAQVAQAESYRKLRVAMDFANIDTAAKTIAVTSALEQEGKSTTVANLAVTVALTGRRVILVDLDLRRPYLWRFFDVPDGPGVTDVALGSVALQDALVSIALGTRPTASGPSNGQGRDPVQGVLQILPAGASLDDPSDFLETAALWRVVEIASTRADVVFLDAPPLLPVSDTMSIASRCDAMIIVARSEMLRRPILDETARLLATCSAKKLGFVLAGSGIGDVYDYDYHGYGNTPSVARRLSHSQGSVTRR